MVCQWRKRLHEHEGATALACGARRNRDCCMDGGQPARENDILNLKREVQADARQDRLRMTEAEAVTGNLEQTWDASTVGSIGRLPTGSAVTPNAPIGESLAPNGREPSFAVRAPAGMPQLSAQIQREPRVQSK